MKKQCPSIFNDVMGPVMRGPSSSHCAAALRIGRMARDLMEGDIREVLVEYDPSGSLVTTHESQGSDMGLYSGLLGYEPSDGRMLDYREEIKRAGIAIRVTHIAYGAVHPSTYRITLRNERRAHQLQAISSGGGMIEITELDGAEVAMQGDFWETLLFFTAGGRQLADEMATWVEAEEISVKEGRQPFLQISTTAPIDAPVIARMRSHEAVDQVAVIGPVLPVISRREIELPFLNAAEMERFNESRKLQLWELAVAYESARGHISAAEVEEQMAALARVMADAVDAGLRGTEFADRILPAQSLLFKEKMDRNKLLDDPLLNRIILCVSATMEVKSSMGVFVAAPTAGACGALPGAIIGAGRTLRSTDEEIVRAFLAAGLIGVFIAARSTFAAESAGCQAECGSASGMAAAGLVQLAGGSLSQALAAASLALQNSFGMTCDPIANRVEAPCLGKNVMAAANALACANMALAGYQALIPLDEVLQAFDQVGRSLPRELRCTALGGLSQTPSALRIEASLQRK